MNATVKKESFVLTQKRIAKGILTPELLKRYQELEEAKKFAAKLGLQPGIKYTDELRENLNIAAGVSV